MFRKLAGFIFLIIGILGVLLSIGGFIYSGRAVDAVVTVLGETGGFVGTGLATVKDSLGLARSTIGDVNASLETVETTADTLAKTLEDTQPLLEEVAQIVGEDAPNSIESVQQAVPEMAQVAGVIDDTLLTLNNFKIDENILGFELKYDLGVNYEPAVPFNETVSQLGSSFDDLPERLRDLEPSLVSANDNIGLVSESIYAVSDDLVTINGRIAEVEPLLGEYIGIVQDVDSSLSNVQSTLQAQVGNIKLALKIGMAWLGFLQFSLLYLGWDLMTRIDEDEIEEEVEEAVEEALARLDSADDSE